jgi:dTDP-4-amino-4,6-dideoxygalactose transaminase
MTDAIRTIPFGRPIIGDEERAAVMAVLSGHILVHGPRAKEFEQNFAAWTGAPHAVSVANCTAAMHLLYFSWGIGPGDEVICPAQTHTATAHAVELTGAKAVFVDAERRTGNIDIAAIAAAITPRTKAIAVVHYLGMPVEMEGVVALARRHGLKVVEDCALAIGTRVDGVHAGLFGDAGAFSFYPVKHMTTAEGGMIITRDGDLAAKLLRQRAFGVDRTVSERSVPGEYDVTMLGFNYRLNEIAAAIGIEQIRRLDDILARREANYRRLYDGLTGVAGITLFDEPKAGQVSSRYCLSMMLDERLTPQRPEIIAALNARGVGTSIYYPRPVPDMTYYRDKYGAVNMPNAAWISYSGIALPVGPHLGAEDMDYVVQVVADVLRDRA